MRSGAAIPSGKRSETWRPPPAEDVLNVGDSAVPSVLEVLEQPDVRGLHRAVRSAVGVQSVKRMRMIEAPSRLKPPRRSSQSPATSPVDVLRCGPRSPSPAAGLAA
jgi:hypothetical protein